VRARARGRVGAVVAVLVLALVASSMSARRAQAATIYTGSGFDTCAAPSTSTMSAWLSSSYRSLGIYIGGADRACGDGNLSASWVTTVEGQGWNLVPLYVGLQAPCVSQAGLSLIDPSQAATQGALSADDAATRARFFGLVNGSPIYFDMEGYGSDSACVATVQAFLNSWVAELHVQGFVAGVYGSSSSTIHDQAVTPYPNRPDDIWFANWNGKTNLFGDSAFPDTLWSGSQRLHQYQANVAETHGGVTITIDRDYDGGAVVGPGQGCASGLVAGGSPPATPAPAGWSAWNPVAPAPPVGIASAPAVASWSRGRLDLFVTGRDAALWHRWSGDGGTGFSGWESLGRPPGGLTCTPAAVSWAPNRIDVFGRGADTALWHTWWDGAQWASWESLGGSLTSSPSVASWTSGRLDVVAVGTDSALWHKWYQGQWRPWDSLGGFAVLDPAAVSWGPNRIDLFVLSFSNQLWHQWWNGQRWSGWFQEVKGHFASGPAAASWAAGRLDLFLASGADAGNPLAHLFLSSGWHQDSLGGSLATAPAAVGSAGSRLDAFVVGADGNVWQRSFG
jgi:hypothetical protein